MNRGDIWFAAAPGGDRPVLVLTRDPIAGRIGSVVVAALTRTVRGHTLPKDAFRRRITSLSPVRMHHACRVLQAATGC